MSWNRDGFHAISSCHSLSDQKTAARENTAHLKKDLTKVRFVRAALLLFLFQQIALYHCVLVLSLLKQLLISSQHKSH